MSYLWYCYDCGDGPHESVVDPLHCGVCSGHNIILEELKSSCPSSIPFYTPSMSYGSNVTAQTCDTFYSNSPESGESARSWSSLAHTMVPALSFAVGSIVALDVGDYSGAWSSALWSSSVCREPLAESNPSAGREEFCAGHTIISAIVFTAAATAIHHLQRNDIYQDHFLFAGITCGIGIGLSLGKGLEGTIFKVLPWGILVALLFSIMMHKLLRLKKHRWPDRKQVLPYEVCKNEL